MIQSLHSLTARAKESELLTGYMPTADSDRSNVDVSTMNTKEIELAAAGSKAAARQHPPSHC